MTPRRLGTTDFTIGWICALPIELAAAQAVLDEQYEAFPQDSFDPNIYTLGRIDTINVVLACLPAGQIGVGPAAISAARLRARFPSIRFGLMVGVGGGVPSEEVDIRLGDVVVSQPVGQHGGVVQYDSGKTGKGGLTTRTGSLNSPPSVLLNAVSQLRANQYRNESNILAHLRAFDNLPQFQRNTAGPDVLYRPTYHHVGGSTCTQCSINEYVKRSDRKISKEVKIHCGTIASGNQVIKDGMTRDRVSKELGGILCFEMEAAGLMNDFPCLVIRGICDYADSHKNKAWQPYAAATAAACAKEILALLPASILAVTDAGEKSTSFSIPFSLKHVPVGKFAERPGDLEALERALLPQVSKEGRRTLVLHGLGGAGKTQLVANFARRHQRKFSAVIWLDGSSEGTLKQSLAAFANRLSTAQLSSISGSYDPGHNRDVNVAVKVALDWLRLQDNRDWLLVIDNVDRDYEQRDQDPEAYDINDYLPEADHGSVLITTRLPHLGHLGERHEAKKVDEECARAIFRVWYGKFVGHEADDLLKMLDGLPLALAQAAAYMSRNLISFSTYTRLYNEQWNDLMPSQDPKSMSSLKYANGTVSTTWMVSYLAIRVKSREAGNLLLLWAHLDNKGLWFGLLNVVSNHKPLVAERMSNWIGETARNELEFIRVIGLLRSYSLVEEMEDGTGYATHPVVHQWALSIQENTQRATLSAIATLIVGSAVSDPIERDAWKVNVRLLPHAERCVTHVTDNVSIERDQEPIVNASWVNDPLLLSAINSLGMLFRELGRLTQTEKLFRRALRARESLLGPRQADTLDSVNSLASLYLDLGLVEEAERMFERALEGVEILAGVEDIRFLLCLGNLATIYQNTDRLEQAEAYHKRAITVLESTRGPKDLWTLLFFSGLCDCLQKYGRINEAQDLYHKVLLGYEQHMSLDDCTYKKALDTVTLLGLLYKKKREFDSAVFWLSRSLKGYQRLYGSDHSNVETLRRQLEIAERRLSDQADIDFGIL